MSDIETYDARVRAIRAYNQLILDDFRVWLEQKGLILLPTLQLASPVHPVQHHSRWHML